MAVLVRVYFVRSFAKLSRALKLRFGRAWNSEEWSGDYLHSFVEPNVFAIATAAASEYLTNQITALPLATHSMMMVLVVTMVLAVAFFCAINIHIISSVQA